MRHLSWLFLIGFFLLPFTDLFANLFLIIGSFGFIFLTRHLRSKQLDYQFRNMLKNRFKNG